MDSGEVVENFYGVYLLKCLNPKFKGRTYIGYTVNPSRRIKQHNRGKKFGGAWRTSQRGPWEMILTVHGFPSDVSALRFEWAWQHPLKSRRLRHIVSKKKSSETSLDYNVKLMFLMLSVPPWNRLPLTIRWLSADAAVDAPPNLTPPPHMPVVYGEVKSKKIKNAKMRNGERREMENLCQLCDGAIAVTDLMQCLNSDCKGAWHIFCLANEFLDQESTMTCSASATGGGEERQRHIIPVEGSCPVCKSFVLWGDLIRKKNGCYANLKDSNESTLSSSLMTDS